MPFAKVERAKSESESESEDVAESEVDSEAEAEAKSKVNSEDEAVSEAVSEAEPEAESESESDYASDVSGHNDTGTNPHEYKEKHDINSFLSFVLNFIDIIESITGEKPYSVSMTKRSVDKSEPLALRAMPKTSGDKQLSVRDISIRLNPNKKKLNDAMVSPNFPVKLQIFSRPSNGRIVHCTGTLCSPLLSEVQARMFYSV
jgi:hypothetical protein